ncbi:hypothetical protein [Sinomonas terrae]|uniref:Uncharacterized protein n=1 Tax=Sinomonas terrae TaxID=2908838 RepID=A0ABS9U1W8_9MICC|nr:hypothetical protein [Sinomonas terrae]MCH6470691.1 hypothetical protein [Sinomonas terrae]
MTGNGESEHAQVTESEQTEKSKMNSAAADESTDEQSSEPEYPEDQMKLIHDEVNRARLATVSRISGFYTRATILVSASGIYTALQATKHVDVLGIAGIALFLAAALIGISALWPRSHRPEADIAASVDALLAGPSRYRVQEAIMHANREALIDDMQLAEKIGKRVRWGYAVLVLAWAVSSASAFMTVSFNWKGG